MPLKLLVIENDRLAATLMTQVFVSQGADVQTAADATAASALARRIRFDGIFLELGLGSDNGVELTEQIRQSSWNTRTPIILVSRNADARAAARAFQAGGTFFLPKPLKQNAIRRALLSTRAVMLDERRRYSRISLSTPIQCFAGTRELYGCVAHNLSASGMLFQEDGSLTPHEEVRLQFRMEKTNAPIVARARVVRLDQEQRAGARFLAMSFDDRERILKRIAAEVDNL
jgi:CheY-like chemotaxis protein